MKGNANKEGALLRSVRVTRFLLTPAQKRKAVLVMILSTVSSILEVFGLATLVPIVVVCAEPGGIFKNKYFRAVYETLHFQTEQSFLITILIGVIFFFVLKTVFTSWVNYVQAQFTGQTGYDVIKSQLTKFSGLTFWNFNELGSGKLINSSLNVPNSFLYNLLRPMVAMASESVIAFSIVVGLVVYNPILIFLLVVVLVPPMAVTYRVVRSRVQGVQSRINDLWPISIGFVNDLFTGFVELKLARRQQKFIGEVLRAQGEVYELDAKNYVYSLFPQKVIELAAVAGVVIIMLYSIVTHRGSSGLVALVGLFAAAAYRLMPSLNRILTSMVTIKGNQHLLDEIESHQGDESQEQVHSVQAPLKFERDLVLDNLTFSFPHQSYRALNGIDITIKKKEKIGFIGSSGSGKTTLMNVLLRFYTEQQGKLLVDGVPLGPQNIDAWHQLIGYVKQDTFLMQASIRDNITLGETDPNEQRLLYAIEQASLKTFVDALPEGMHTFIGERGSKLSGGQRQRIGIARALYKQTQVLILDEATSALDNETEREVNEAINNLSKIDLTILIVAHRLTTLRECDRVYELSSGQLVAEHQYEDLLNRIK